MSGSYHCPCGWSRVILVGETVEDARRAHEASDIHQLERQAYPLLLSPAEARYGASSGRIHRAARVTQEDGSTIIWTACGKVLKQAQEHQIGFPTCKACRRWMGF